MSQNLKNLTQLNEPSRFLSAYSKKIQTPLTFPENSRWTKQSFAQECDINTIMARYNNSGELPAINQRAPEYLDVTGLDYQAAMEFTANARSLFQELPSAIRNRFGNDPAQFLDFTSDEKNRQEMAEMGLLRDEVAMAVLYPNPIKDNPSQPQNGASAPAAETPPSAP